MLDKLKKAYEDIQADHTEVTEIAWDKALIAYFDAPTDTEDDDRWDVMKDRMIEVMNHLFDSEIHQSSCIGDIMAYALMGAQFGIRGVR